MRLLSPFLVTAILMFLVGCNSPTKLFVSPDGSDQNDGSINSPYLSAKKALAEVRSLKINAPNKDIVINFREGNYRIGESLTLDSLMSGVSLEAYKDEKAIFSGGVSISKIGRASCRERV